jgi:hypothetical protein
MHVSRTEINWQSIAHGVSSYGSDTIKGIQDD